MKKTKNRCPECQKLMVRHKRMKDFWWSCARYPLCDVTARDYKGAPEFVKEQIVKTDLLCQLNFIKDIVNDPRAQSLIRLLQSKKSLSALPEKHVSMYYRVVEPVRASISFTKCCRCNYTLDAAESLNLGAGRHLCDYCWGH